MALYTQAEQRKTTWKRITLLLNILSEETRECEGFFRGNILAAPRLNIHGTVSQPIVDVFIFKQHLNVLIPSTPFPICPHLIQTVSCPYPFSPICFGCLSLDYVSKIVCILTHPYSPLWCHYFRDNFHDHLLANTHAVYYTYHVLTVSSLHILMTYVVM